MLLLIWDLLICNYLTVKIFIKPPIFLKYMVFNKIQNMFLGIAIGDAFGAGYEFLGKSRAAVKKAFDFTKYKAHPCKEFKHKKGMYTDDAQMSIAIGELMLSDKPFNHSTLADAFVRCYKRDPITGYSVGFKSLLDNIKDGQELLEKIDPDSKRNGAAMRALPIGMIKELDKVIEYAYINAEVTHNTPQGIVSSVGTALLSHHQIYNIDADIFDYINDHIWKIHFDSANYFKKIRQMDSEDPSILFGKDNISKGVPCDGVRTLGAVLYILSNFGTDANEVLKKSVLLGGDTDSVASIALGTNSIQSGIDDLDPFLYKGLTNHKYGKDYIIDLGKKLSEKYC